MIEKSYNLKSLSALAVRVNKPTKVYGTDEEIHIASPGDWIVTFKSIKEQHVMKNKLFNYLFDTKSSDLKICPGCGKTIILPDGICEFCDLFT